MYNCLSLQPDLKLTARRTEKKEVKRCDAQRISGRIRISSLHAEQWLTREMRNKSRNESFEKSEEKFGDKNTHRIFAVRSKKLQVLRNTDRCFLRKENLKKQQKVFDDLIKALTFASPNDRGFENKGRREAERSLKEWKQQYVNQAFTVRLC